MKIAEMMLSQSSVQKLVAKTMLFGLEIKSPEINIGNVLNQYRGKSQELTNEILECESHLQWINHVLSKNQASIPAINWRDFFYRGMPEI